MVDLLQLEYDLKALRVELGGFAALSASRKIDAVLEHTIPTAQRLRDKEGAS